MKDKKKLIKQARNTVENLYGNNFARKASDDFCLSLSENAKTSDKSEFSESFNSNQASPVILELTEDFSIKGKSDADAGKSQRQEVWTRMQKTIENLQEYEESLVPASQILRQMKIDFIKSNFYKSLENILDKLKHNPNQPVSESTPISNSDTTQICWLNRTVRTIVEPKYLAEIAEDKHIAVMDLPRKINAEIAATAKTVGASGYRTKFNVNGKGIIVAVIDSEVFLKHPALKGRVFHKANFTKESWGNPGSHGTAVAGIIAANDKKYVGIAPEAMIYNYKVLANNKFLNADDFGGSLAIQQALEDGANIANCSWGAGPAGDGTSREARACNEAWALGMTIVKSAGNLGAKSKTLTTPADADGVIVVGATDRKGLSVQDYSSRGPTPKGTFRPHLVAPGGTFLEGIVSCLVNGKFGDCGCGTSFAAPHIAGLLALILELKPDLMPAEQRELLFKKCKEFPLNDKNTHGKGLISVS